MNGNNGGQGQSSATIDKERCLASALSIGMSIARNAFAGKGFTYFHFDANAGSGFNDKAGVIGSPVVFHRIADLHLTNMQRLAVFCDHDRRAILELKAGINSHDGWAPRSAIFNGDNEEVIEVFAEHIRRSRERPEYAVGSIIVDPNGYFYRNAKGEGAPVKGLTRFAQEFKRIDIVLNLNTRTYKLQRSQNHGVMEPMDVLACLNKKHWLVKLTQVGGDQFLLVVGRNMETGDHRAVGFHKLESAEGRHIMTIAEGKRQGKLFGDDDELFPL